MKTYGITVAANANKITFTSEDKGESTAHVSAVKFDKGTAADADQTIGAVKVTKGKYEGQTYDFSNIKTDDTITVNGKDYTDFKDFAELKALLEADGIEVIDQGGTSSL